MGARGLRDEEAQVACVWLHAVRQLARLALGRHIAIPTRGVRLLIQPQDAPADGVAVMVAVKQPAVKASLADCSLNRFEVHNGHDTRCGRPGGYPNAEFGGLAAPRIM